MSVSKRWVLVVVAAAVFASAAAFVRNGAFDTPGAGANDAVPAQYASWVDLANPARDPSGATKTPLRVGYGTYIVMFEEAPLAAYRGEVAGIPAPRRDVKAKNGRLRLDVTGPAARAYVGHLRKRQAALNARMEAILGRSVPVKAAMQYGVNAIAVDLSAEEADAIGAMPGVESVEPQAEYTTMSDLGARLIGAEPVWDGSNPGSGGVQYQGEGMVVALLDTGINFGSPSFAATAPVDGYVHTNPLGDGNYLGTCANGGADIGRCNAKLIGGFDFVCGAPGNQCGVSGVREEAGFGDTSGHGTHVASISAGNPREETYLGVPVRVTGVAPRANIVAYDVCYRKLTTSIYESEADICPEVAVLAALDHIVAAGVVDVVNLSLGTYSSTGSLTQLLINSGEAGVYISTPSSLERGVATVRPSTHTSSGFVFRLNVTGPQPLPDRLSEIFVGEGQSLVMHGAAIPDDTPVKVLIRSDGSLYDGCSGLSSNFFAGAIAIVAGGGYNCWIEEKAQNTANAGAVAVLIATNFTSQQVRGGGPSAPKSPIRVFSINLADVNALRDYLAVNPNTTAGIGLPAQATAETPDVLGYGGYILGAENLRSRLKPDFVAPGVNILAADAGNTLTGFENLLGIRSGYSMASANHVGAAALVRQARPDWTVAEVRSAFAMTATDQLLLPGATGPAKPTDVGSGRIRIDRAINAGLVMHETAENYRADRDLFSFDPNTLNQPYMVDTKCYAACRFRRTFRNPHANESTWNLSFEGDIGGRMPASITVPAGGSVSVEFALRSTAGRRLTVFGSVMLTPTSSEDGPPLRLPVVLKDLKALDQDYDQDGFSDIHWRNVSTGENDLWLMRGSDIKSISTIYYEPNQAWTVVGAGSFNTTRTGQLWRNTQTGAVYIQDVLPQNGNNSQFAFTVPDQNWQVAAIGDFLGNGYSNIVWRNAVTGRVDMWRVGYPNSNYATTIYREPDPAWKIRGAGDFDGDGRDDLFWRHDQTGKNYVMFMRDYSVLPQSNFLIDVADQAWQVAAIGDFDGDGFDDLYWRNRETGFNDLWLMDGLEIKSISTVYYEPNQAWGIAASADYNNDGYADLVWRNAQTGDNYLMLMRDGEALPESTMLPQVADLDWRITGLRGSN